MSTALARAQRFLAFIAGLAAAATGPVKVEIWLAGLIALLTTGFVWYKVQYLGYTMTTIQPEKGYFVRLLMELEGNREDVRLDVTLPVTSERQHILQEKQNAEGFRYTITASREGRWFTPKLDGKRRVTYSFFAQTEARDYPLPNDLRLPLPPRRCN